MTNCPKSRRMIMSEQGVFYRTRGGRLSGPFNSEIEARNDLNVFIQVVAIEEELDIENLKWIS